METKYKIEPSGTAYTIETPQSIINVLENARSKGTRIKITFGDIKTGKNWNDEYNTIGRVGRSTGNYKIPLLIKTTRSFGGGAILTDCIIKIVDAKSKIILYKASNFKEQKIIIGKSDLIEYSHAIYIDNEIYSRHKSERRAKILLSKLT